RLSYQLRMQPGVLEGLEEATRAWTESTRARLERLLADAGVQDAAIEARVLFAAIDGAAQHFALDPETYPVEEVTRALVRRLAGSWDLHDVGCFSHYGASLCWIRIMQYRVVVMR